MEVGAVQQLQGRCRSQAARNQLYEQQVVPGSEHSTNQSDWNKKTPETMLHRLNWKAGAVAWCVTEPLAQQSGTEQTW